MLYDDGFSRSAFSVKETPDSITYSIDCYDEKIEKLLNGTLKIEQLTSFFDLSYMIGSNSYAGPNSKDNAIMILKKLIEAESAHGFEVNERTIDFIEEFFHPIQFGDTAKQVALYTYTEMKKNNLI